MRKGILRKRILEGQFRKGIAEGHFRKGIAEGHFRKGMKGTVHKLEFIPNSTQKKETLCIPTPTNTFVCMCVFAHALG